MILTNKLNNETSKNERKLGIYRIHHKDHRVGAIVLAKEVIVGGIPERGQRYFVTVDGVKFLDFCGASFIKYVDDNEADKILSMINKNVLEMR